MLKMLKRIIHTKKIVEEKNREYREEVKKTTTTVEKATKVFSNGATVKIYKSVHRTAH